MNRNLYGITQIEKPDIMNTKKITPKAEARKIIAAACKDRLTIGGEAAVRYIILFAGLVFAELEQAKKRLEGITCSSLTQAVCDFINTEKANAVYASDRALLTDYYRAIRNYGWNLANRSEAEFILENLKGSERFCSSFFYDGSEKKGAVNMGPIVSKLAYEMLSSYHVSIDKREISSIVYEFFWDEGRWSALDGFRFECSLFSWLETIARREVIRRLEKQGLIKTPKGKTSGNQRHVMLSQSPERCEHIIEEEIHGIIDRQILTGVYVERLDDRTIMQALHMDEDTFNAAYKKAEKHLIEAMLRSEETYEDILRDKDPRDITVSLDAAMEIIGWAETKIGEPVLGDILGVNLKDGELEECAQNILDSVSASMPWKERDRIIFSNRYFYRTDAVELAEQLGVSRAYIDTRFSRLQSRFNKALRRWAVGMKFLTKKDVADIERRIEERKAEQKAQRLAEEAERPKSKSRKNK